MGVTDYRRLAKHGAPHGNSRRGEVANTASSLISLSYHHVRPRHHHAGRAKVVPPIPLQLPDSPNQPAPPSRRRHAALIALAPLHVA
ncbi:hypothetical protein DENSPDRAFT_886551 [Dentipellis sp. KUC8613]|nr:hypothetical protein DENSPDRAFT_886551 [Dentipellis sp. KUC8613]